MNFDFGYSQNDTASNANSDNVNAITNLDTGKADNDNGGNPVSVLDDDGGDRGNDDGDGDGEGNGNQPKPNNKPDNGIDDKGDNGSEELQPGTIIDVDGVTYTVDNNGNVVDPNGNIYKEKAEVNDWIKSFDQVDDSTNEINIQSIQEAIGVDIVGDDDKPVQFDNTPEGIASYVNSVIETAREENYETAINSLYDRYPIIKDVLQYYIANGESLDGYGEVPDRSGITIDDSNEAQHEAIIRTAWIEQGRKGDVESYIQYLKSSGTLLATAREELEGLQESDANYRAQLQAEAERVEQENIERISQYWDGVKETIDSRTIAGYKIPDNIIISRNGQKLSVTPNDFYNYLYLVDNNGQSAYARDLAQETPEARRDDEILRAYLKFVGGNYSNLVEMAINDEKVKNLRLRAKGTTTNSVRINRPKTSPAKGQNIDLGYN